MKNQNQSKWTFLTNHAHVLLSLAKCPNMRMRELAEQVGITERAVQRIVADLVDNGYLDIERDGRCNSYLTHREKSLRHPLESHRHVADLLGLLDIRFKEHKEALADINE